MEAIILAGGFGKRLKSIVKDIPKPMAIINGKPFLEYTLNYLLNQNINHIILSIGYKAHCIIEHFGKNYKGCEITYFIEDKPLGTGGAIKKALQLSKTNTIYILNGDTFFDISLASLSEAHYNNDAILTLSLKLMKNFDRYGCVVVNDKGSIIQFSEKKYQAKGLINAGVYLLNKNLFANIDLPEKFSFEKFMQQNVSKLHLYSATYPNYFIDIGIPEDYLKAQSDFNNYKF